MEERLKKLSRWIKEQRIDVAWITSTVNVYYLTGCYIVPHERLFGLWVFAEQDPIFLCPKMEQAAVKNSGWRYDIISYDDSEDPWELIQNKLSHRFVGAPQTMAIEKEHVTCARMEQLQSFWPDISLVRVDDVLKRFRLVKQPQEIKWLKQAAAFADEAMLIGIESVYDGCTELEIALEIETAMKKRGIQEMSFGTVVLFGSRTALPHGVPSDRKLTYGDLILIDLGVKVAGYCSDLTRTFAFGAITEKQKEMYHAVLNAQQVALAQCKPLIQISQLDVATNQSLDEAGYGEYVLHRTGHGLGLEIHEAPSIDDNSQEKLQPGVVITIEPGIYIPDVGGIRIEDDVYITDSGHDVLTQFPKELYLLT